MLNPPKILMYSKTSMTTTLDPQWSLGSIHKPRRYHSSSRWSLVPKKILYIFLDGTLRINTQVSSKYQSRANRQFSLPWNYPNKWTVPLRINLYLQYGNNFEITDQGHIFWSNNIRKIVFGRYEEDEKIN